VVDLVPSSVDPTLPLKSEIQVVDPSPSLVDLSLPLESDTHQVIDLIPSSVDPTLPLESEVDIAHVFLVNTDSTIQGGISPPTVEPPPSNEAIHFDWHGITGPVFLPMYLSKSLFRFVVGASLRLS
jgi:hypothetical protein